MKKVPFSALGKIRNDELVKAGETKKIFEFKIPSGYIGFLYKFANTWYLNTYLVLQVDGEIVQKIETRFTVTEPFRYETPVVVRHSIEVWAVNNSSEDHYFEFWIDGIAVELE